MDQFLPDRFLEEMNKLLGAEMYPAFLASYKRPVYSAIRVNSLKTNAADFSEKTDFALTPVPWIENGFYYEESSDVSHHPWYYAGLYYIQEPSAMTPASLLPIEEGDMVLDLCAAPGGKATELGARLGHTGFLLANDISHSRAKALLFNLERFGICHMAVCSEDPEKLVSHFPEFFDKILIDAPCSGEGMFHKEPQMVRFYEEHGPAYYSEIQKKLILQAADMLKPGGKMLFSTCTFSPREDEDTISYLLKERPEFTLLPAASYEGFSAGLPPCEKAVRIFPHLMKGEGHFAALLEKRPMGKEMDHAIPPHLAFLPFEKLPDEAKSFLSPLMQAACFDRDGGFAVKKELLYYLPRQSVTDRKLRFLRTGLLLGEMKKNRFEPSQALAMALSAADYPLRLDMPASDHRVVRYLKGETIEASELSGMKGFVLVCVDGHPLGWGKTDRGRVKNKYNTAWRMQ